MTIQHTLESVPDELLLRRLVELLRQSRDAEADLVAHIGEVDARRLYAREASPSMFVYCTERLHLSEAEAYLRIAAARASRAHPVLLDMLADGRLHLTAVARLAPHLTVENRESLLARAVHRTKREIDELVAALQPQADAPALMRKLPERRETPPATSGSPVGPSTPAMAGFELRPDGVDRPVPELRPDGVATVRSEIRPGRLEPPALVQPLAPGRYKVQFTAGPALCDKLERLRALMRSSVPDGDLAAIIETAVTEKLERLETRRFGRKTAPAGPMVPSEVPAAKGDGGPVVRPAARARPGGAGAAAVGGRARSRPVASLPDARPTNGPSSTRHVPAAVRRAVYERDDGQCRYVDEQGRRCTARAGLEFHHRHPFVFSGDHSPANVSLLCRAHNGLLAEVDFGRDVAARNRRSSSQPPGLRLPSATSLTSAVKKAAASGG